MIANSERIADHPDRRRPPTHVPSSAGAHVSLSLDGVAIGGFDNAVLLQGGDHHGIRGSHFGPGLGVVGAKGWAAALTAAAEQLPEPLALPLQP